MSTKSLSDLFFVSSLLLWSCALKTRTQLRQDRGMASVRVQAPSPVESEASQVFQEVREELVHLDNRLLSLETLKDQERPDLQPMIQALEEKIRKLEETQLHTVETLTQLEEQWRLLQDWVQKTQATAIKELPKNPKVLFQEAKKTCKSGDSDACLKHCEQVLKPDQKLPSVQKAECLRLRAEAWTKKGEHKKAIVDWSLLLEQYPRSMHVPEALLKTAEGFKLLGLAPSGKPLLEELIQRFPKSPQAVKAKVLLKNS